MRIAIRSRRSLTLYPGRVARLFGILLIFGFVEALCTPKQRYSTGPHCSAQMGRLGVWIALPEVDVSKICGVLEGWR